MNKSTKTLAAVLTKPVLDIVKENNLPKDQWIHVDFYFKAKGDKVQFSLMNIETGPHGAPLDRYFVRKSNQHN